MRERKKEERGGADERFLVFPQQEPKTLVSFSFEIRSFGRAKGFDTLPSFPFFIAFYCVCYFPSCQVPFDEFLEVFDQKKKKNFN